MASLGALSITLTDLADTPVLEPGVGETPIWPEVVVTGLFERPADVDDFKSIFCRAPGVESPHQLGFSPLDDRDWERAWLADFKPMKFGKDTWIVPGEQWAPDPGATVIKLDPGLAFGSGTHPTTRLCMEWIDSQDFQDSSVIDFDCGSGVLGVAAALKGAAAVLSIDNDPQSLAATRDNATRNRVETRLETAEITRLGENCADVILANILAGTLVKLAPILCSALKPGGLIVLSGILKEQAGEVSGEFTRWLEGIKQTTLEDWVLISGKHREQNT